MAITQPHRSGPIRLHWVGMGAAVDIGGIRQTTIDAGVELERVLATDSIYPEVVSLKTLRPGITFVSTQLQQVLDEIGIFGECVTSDGSHPGMYVYIAKRDCIGLAAGSSHRRYLSKNGIIWIDNISVEHGGDAQATVRMTPIYDGTNAPITIEDSVAVPSVTAGKFTWTIGKVTIGGVVVTGIRRIDIAINATQDSEGSDSETYDSFASLAKVEPLVTLTGVNPKWVETVAPLLGGNGTHANTSIILKRRDASAATEVHIQLTMAGLIHPVQIFDGSNESIGQTSIAIALKHDGTNVPILVDTTVTYTP